MFSRLASEQVKMFQHKYDTGICQNQGIILNLIYEMKRGQTDCKTWLHFSIFHIADTNFHP